MLEMVLPVPINKAADARHTKAISKLYSTKSWPRSSFPNCLQNDFPSDTNCSFPQAPSAIPLAGIPTACESAFAADPRHLYSSL
jgi:hypothetical protein